jgi:hypothetical protein
MAELENTAEGILADVEFIGTDLRMTYRMPDGSRVVMRRQNSGRAVPQPGETRRLGFRQDDLRLFSR